MAGARAHAQSPLPCHFGVTPRGKGHSWLSLAPLDALLERVRHE